MLGVEIRVKGRIDEDWTEWFQGLSIEYTEEEETVLSGEVLDQSELYGLIAKLRDLGLDLIYVKHSEDGEEQG
jgi:hypothetical protein